MLKKHLFLILISLIPNTNFCNKKKVHQHQQLSPNNVRKSLNALRIDRNRRKQEEWVGELFKKESEASLRTCLCVTGTVAAGTVAISLAAALMALQFQSNNNPLNRRFTK